MTFRPSTDISTNTSIQSHRSTGDLQARQSDITSELFIQILAFPNTFFNLQ